MSGDVYGVSNVFLFHNVIIAYVDSLQFSLQTLCEHYNVGLGWINASPDDGLTSQTKDLRHGVAVASQ